MGGRLRAVLTFPPVGVGGCVAALFLGAFLLGAPLTAPCEPGHARGAACESKPPAVAPPLASEPARTADERRDEQNLRAQQTVADAAVLAVILSALGFGLTVIGVQLLAKTLTETRNAAQHGATMAQAAMDSNVRAGEMASAALAANQLSAAALEHTREASRKQLRAYLVCSLDRCKYYANTGLFRVCVTALNVGQTPANQVESAHGWSFHRSRPPENTINVEWGEHTPPGSRSVVGPTMDFKINFDLALPPPFPPPSRREMQEALEEWASTDNAVFVHGMVRYLDVFDEVHFTKFCFRIRAAAMLKVMLSPGDEDRLVDPGAFSTANQFNEVL